MKRWLRWVLAVGGCLIVLLAVAFLNRRVLIRELVEWQISAKTGLRVSIEDFNADLSRHSVTITGLRILNPPEFGRTAFLHFPEVHVEYDPAALSAHKLRLRLLRINLAEMTIVESVDGRSNLDLFQKKGRPGGGRAEGKGIEFAGIDRLEVTLGTVKRYSMRSPEHVAIIDLKVKDRTFTNLRSKADFILAGARLAIELALGDLLSRRGPSRAGPPSQPR